MIALPKSPFQKESLIVRKLAVWNICQIIHIELNDGPGNFLKVRNLAFTACV